MSFVCSECNESPRFCFCAKPSFKEKKGIENTPLSIPKPLVELADSVQEAL